MKLGQSITVEVEDKFNARGIVTVVVQQVMQFLKNRFLNKS